MADNSGEVTVREADNAGHAAKSGEATKQRKENNNPQGSDGDKPVMSKRRRKRMSREQRRREKMPKVDFAPLVKENENLAKYYKLQPIMDEGEFDDFMAGLLVSLPASFRINTFEMGQAMLLRQLVQGPELSEFLVDDNKSSIPDRRAKKQEDHVIDAKLEPLSWYPMKLGWQMNITRLDLKKSPILEQFHKFLMAETDNGFISRQEAVSMIPPLVLDVQRGQQILDMCAAPGSKTAQLLEYLKHDIMNWDNGVEKQNEPTVGNFDDGMVVANDVNNKRCYMLVHQASRLNSPNCVIINQDAAKMPELRAGEDENSSPFKFDRILCDVPCSGDGTIRKNPDVWKKWNVGNTNNFHGMQVKILKRAIELLKQDGLVVYSTCSMSPVEDEAVIAAVLRMSQGKLKLEKFSHKLHGLKFKSGTSKWSVVNRNMEVLESFEKISEEYLTQHPKSMFPPTEEESKDFELDKCVRILPHLQNTGGFFIAVLRKLTDQMPWEEVTTKTTTAKPTSQENDDDDGKQKVPPPPAKKKRKFDGFKEEPFFFVDESDADWLSIRDFYGFKENFPFTQLLHRKSQEGRKRCFHLVSKQVKNFILANREESSDNFVKIINAGMRLFQRASTESGFRICQDGVSEVLPYVDDKFKVSMTKDDLVLLLKNNQAAFDDLSHGKQVRDEIRPGSFIFIYKHESGTKEEVAMPLVAWRGERTVALYVSKTYRTHLIALAQLKIVDESGIKLEQDNEDKEQ